MGSTVFWFLYANFQSIYTSVITHQYKWTSKSSLCRIWWICLCCNEHSVCNPDTTRKIICFELLHQWFTTRTFQCIVITMHVATTIRGRSIWCKHVFKLPCLLRKYLDCLRFDFDRYDNDDVVTACLALIVNGTRQ
jgi:hypothetical protein